MSLLMSLVDLDHSDKNFRSQGIFSQFTEEEKEAQGEKGDLQVSPREPVAWSHERASESTLSWIFYCLQIPREDRVYAAT